MRYPIAESPIRKLLMFALFFVFISAVAGAIGLIGGGINIPLSLIEDSVFGSYFIPGLILGFVVGGTSLLALIAVLKKNRFAADLSVVAGFGLIIWIFVEMYIIRASHWSHALYFASGMAILLFSFLLRSVEEK